MKKAGDLLSSFLDKRVLEGAREYSDLFTAWETIAGENVAAHSRIVELDRSVLQVEADHPGWIQILQTRQADLLERIRRRFPQLNIAGISFRLMWDRQDLPDGEKRPVAATEARSEATDANAGYESIKDESFKGLLRRLEQSIRDRNKNH